MIKKLVTVIDLRQSNINVEHLKSHFIECYISERNILTFTSHTMLYLALLIRRVDFFFKVSEE